MNKTAKISIICVSLMAAVAVTGVMMAQTNAPAAPRAAAPRPVVQQAGNTAAALQQNPSCSTILGACKTAGFAQGGAKNGNGLWVNCFYPLTDGKGKSPAIKGQPVSVPVNPQDAAACSAAIQASKASH